jgi:hypothetical protein
VGQRSSHDTRADSNLGVAVAGTEMAVGREEAQSLSLKIHHILVAVPAVVGILHQGCCGVAEVVAARRMDCWGGSFVAEKTGLVAGLIIDGHHP